MILKKLNWHRWLIIGFTATVALIIGYLLLSNWQELLAFPWRLRVGYLILVMVFHGLALFATFVAWHLIIARLGKFANLRSNFKFYYLSTLARRIPTLLPYVGGRIFFYRQVGVSGKAVLNGIYFENILVSLGGIITFFVLLPFYGNLPQAIVLPISMGGVLILFLVLVRPALSIEFLNKLLVRYGKSTLDNVPNHRDIILWTVVYIFPWIFAGLSLYFAPLAVTANFSLTLLDALMISTVASLAAMLGMVIPGGVWKEVTAGTMLTAWLPFPTALTLVLIYRLIHTVNEVMWAMIANFAGNQVNNDPQFRKIT